MPMCVQVASQHAERRHNVDTMPHCARPRAARTPFELNDGLHRRQTEHLRGDSLRNSNRCLSVYLMQALRLLLWTAELVCPL